MGAYRKRQIDIERKRGGEKSNYRERAMPERFCRRADKAWKLKFWNQLGEQVLERKLAGVWAPVMIDGLAK